MSITLELSPEEETLLREAAQAAGNPNVAAYIRQSVLSTLADSGRRESDLDFLREEAEKAVRSAQTELMRQGIEYVYLKDNSLIRHFPGGSETTILSPVL